MAVPGSGALSLAGIKNEVDNNEYNPNSTTQASLTTLATGTINNNSTSKPNQSTPHGMQEWYSYDHDAAASFGDDRSFDFDGTNDRLEGSGSLAQQFIGGASTAGAGSISVWVKLDAMAGNGFIFQLSAEEGTTNQILLLWNNAAGRIRGNVKVAGTANTVDSGAGLENDGNWHHVAFTWEYGSKTSSNNECKIYIYGSNTATNSIGSDNWNDGNGPAVVGFGRNHPQNYGNPWNGHMNDIALFTDKLTAVEISTIYNSGTPKNEASHSGLLAYYKMEGYSAGDTTLADDSSNSYSLTITNSTSIGSTDTP
jgi:hypothetical protein